MACEAEPSSRTSWAPRGEHLDQGRETRLFDRAQRRQLMRRDKLHLPGCDRPGRVDPRPPRPPTGGTTGGADSTTPRCSAAAATLIVHQRRLWADVRRTPDLRSRFVVWDLTEGSHDTELARRRAERAANDPPPLTPEALGAILRGLPLRGPRQQLWAPPKPSGTSQGDEAFVPTFFDPRCGTPPATTRSLTLAKVSADSPVTPRSPIRLASGWGGECRWGRRRSRIQVTAARAGAARLAASKGDALGGQPLPARLSVSRDIQIADRPLARKVHHRGPITPLLALGLSLALARGIGLLRRRRHVRQGFQ